MRPANCHRPDMLAGRMLAELYGVLALPIELLPLFRCGVLAFFTTSLIVRTTIWGRSLTDSYVDVETESSRQHKTANKLIPVTPIMIYTPV